MILFVSSNLNCWSFASKELPTKEQLIKHLHVSPSREFTKFLKKLPLLGKDGSLVSITATMKDGDRITVIKTKLVD